MTDIGFYHLERSSLETALPPLLEKILQAGHRAVVMSGSPERVRSLDDHLWKWREESFLPHGSAATGNAAAQPVWITSEEENPNGAGVLVLTDGASAASFDGYERVCELFDGGDEDAVAAARSRWKDYAGAGHTVTYWQQTPQGGWAQKA